MAQTIVLQRGTTTVTSNGSSSTTLFTQTGGTATRVIKSQVGVYFSTQPNSSVVYIAVYHNVSGGQGFLIGWINGANIRAKAYQFVPGAATEDQFRLAPVTTTNLGPASPLIRSNTDGIGAAGASNISFDFSSSSQQYVNNFTPNFYMGPDDSISMKVFASVVVGKSSSNPTANISYSFVTITES